MTAPLTSARTTDLRILALADASFLPQPVAEAFARWRILRARDAVAAAVRKRLGNLEDPMLAFMLERLEAAEDDQGIFEGIYALAEVVELHRTKLGLHSEYLVLVMAGQVNPWGLLGVGRDFHNPPRSVVEASQELWRLAREHDLDVSHLLRLVRDDDLLVALNSFYATPILPSA